jgi:hypothetical protein
VLERKQFSDECVHFPETPMMCRAIDAYRTWTHSLREDSCRLVREAVRPRAIAAEVESSRTLSANQKRCFVNAGERDAD